MASNMISNENSWADQWDTNPIDPYPVSDTKNGSGAKAKYGKKVEQGLGKTKAVASNGMNKVKVGTSVGFNWIKEKYQKTTGKQ